MKTKQFAIVALVVCLFSVLTNDALAFYNPQTGHWLSRDPIVERGGHNVYASIGNDCENSFDLLGLSTGTIEVSGKPLVEDSFAHHARGWDIHLKWIAPTTGDWAKPSACKPCQRAIWLQQYKYGSSDPWKPDMTETSWHNWSDYGRAWGSAAIPPGGTANGDGPYSADTYDQPQQTVFSTLGLLYHNHVFFEALSYVKCIEGRDAGKIYGSVRWGYTWSYDSTPQAIGPFY